METVGPLARRHPNERKAEREAALNRLAGQHYDLMYRVAYRILRNPQDAEEALHNVWLNLCRTPNLPQMDNETAYLAQAVRREAIHIWKKSRKFPAAEEGAEMVLLDARSSPEQVASGAQVQQRINTLPPRERAVVTLWYREGLSLVEIAEILQIPEGTVRRRFMEAKANLKAMLAIKPATKPAIKPETRQRPALQAVAGEGVHNAFAE